VRFQRSKSREKSDAVLVASVAGGLGIAVVVGLAKLVHDLKASRRDGPQAPWERDPPV
jgi:hypothetical protein